MRAKNWVYVIEPTVKRRVTVVAWGLYTWPALTLMSVGYAICDAWQAFFGEILRGQSLFRDAFMQSWEERQ